jgi:hypothetical protein
MVGLTQLTHERRKAEESFGVEEVAAVVGQRAATLMSA